jgi:prophage tail gpP-like protein
MPDPRVTITVNGRPYHNVKQYRWDSDVLQLQDDFSCTLSNEDGILSSEIRRGQSLEVYVSDPTVAAGQAIRKLKGIVTDVRKRCAISGGTEILLQGADLGWHLTHNCAPLHLRLNGITFQRLLERVLDASWGFAGVRVGNEDNRLARLGRVNLGRAGAAQFIAAQENVFAVIPRVQVEAGQLIAPLIIEFAQREGYLVNVSGDGHLQIFRPLATGDPSYTLRHYARDDERSRENNVKDPEFSESIESLYTVVTCVGSILQPPVIGDTIDPNEGKRPGTYEDPNVLPFRRFFDFSDGERYNSQQAQRRARWKQQRGKFDSRVYTCTVQGHAQGGAFWESDTLCSVSDEVLGFVETGYVRGVSYQGTNGAGSITQLTIHERGLLSA